MIEMPEATTIARQMNDALAGKTIQHFARGELIHKFLFLSKSEQEFDAILSGLPINAASSYGRSIYLHLGGSHMLWFGELGGRILYHPQGQPLPAKYHLRWDFADSSAMTFTLQMWGFVRLLEQSEVDGRPKAEVGLPPLSAEFTLERFDQLLENYPEKMNKGVKGFLVTSQHINGIGNSYLQDILFCARVHPARKIPYISAGKRRQLYDAIQETMARAIQLGGREDERDLFDHPGGYRRLMGSRTVGGPCPACGTTIQKISYLGGACYICPQCQA